MNNPKRSVSPQTVTEDEPPTTKSGFGISSLVSYIKGNLPSTSTFQQQTNSSQNFIDISMVEEEKLLNDFSSEKKRRLSIQGHPRNDSIPRSSTLNNNLGSYKTYYENLKTSKQELNNDLERRLSTVYGQGIVKDSAQEMKDGAQEVVSEFNLKVHQPYMKDNSPLQDITRDSTGGSILNQLKYDASEDQFIPEDQLMLEPEFAPLYVDEEGNLVRPPMINLDPRERYHLLQLKRSLEISQSLQKRIKYMVDPKETNSVYLPATNKVETSTQTNTLGHLTNILTFSRNKRKLEAKKNLKTSKRARNNKGFFVGEFYYDVQENDDSKVKNDLNGYLGSINKPKFKAENQPNDHGSKYSTQKSTNQRVGLDLLNNNKVNLELDSEYLEKSEKISNIIKLKETSGKEKVEETTDKGKASETPSSGFQFSINKGDMESIVNKRNATNESVSKNSERLEPSISQKEPVTSKFSFGTTNSVSEAPKLSFGAKNTENSTPTPFSLGSLSNKDKSSSTNPSEKPEFSFSSDKPSIKFGKEDKNESSAKPLFSFGAKSDDKEAQPMLFGTKSEDKKEKSTFSFSKPEGKKEGNTLFSATTEEKKDNSKPTFSFGAKPTEKDDEKSSISVNKSTPTFSFGSKPTEKKEVSTPTFSFGAKPEDNKESNPKESTPTFSFGKSEDKKEQAPTFGFGAKPEDKKEEAPKFSFGKPAGDTKSFSFTSSKNPRTEDDEDNVKRKTPANNTLFGAATPSFSFGQKKEDTPFGLSKKDGGSSVEKSVSPVVFGGVKTGGEAKPAFNFGGASSVAKEPTNAPSNTSFNFGAPAVTDPSTIFGVSGPEKPAFSFGQAAASPKPAFSFGAGTTATPNGSTPAKPFAFAGGAPSNPNFKFAAGINPSPNTGTPKFNFGAQSAPNLATGGAPNFAGSREATPTFGFANNNPNPNLGQPQTTFNFGSREGTPDPASIFGNPSRGTTPNFMNGVSAYNQNNSGLGVNPAGAGFGTNISMPQPTPGIPFQFSAPSANVSTPTPPIPSNRKIAQYRSRRR